MKLTLNKNYPTRQMQVKFLEKVRRPLNEVQIHIIFKIKRCKLKFSSFKIHMILVRYINNNIIFND